MYNQEYIKEHFGEKLNKAIKSCYSDIPDRKRYGKFKDDYCKHAVIEKSKFESRFNSWIYRKVIPEIGSIVMICNVLDCDMDYFLTEQEELRKDIVNASEITGLSYDAIQVLKQYKDLYRDVLEHLILSNSLWELIKALLRHAPINTANVNKDDDGLYYQEYSLMRVLEHAIKRLFRNKVLYDTIKKYRSKVIAAEYGMDYEKILEMPELPDLPDLPE